MRDDPLLDYSLDQRLGQLTAQLNDLAQSIALAKRTGQTDALAQLTTQYRALHAEALRLRADANVAGTPSATTLAIGRFVDRVATIGNDLGAGVLNTVGFVATLTRYGPWILAAGVVLLVLYYGKAYKVALSRAGK